MARWYTTLPHAEYLFLVLWRILPPRIQEVDKLWASVESTRAELAPRKKFAFRSKSKSKSKTSGKSKSNASGGAEEAVRLGVSACETEADAEEGQAKKAQGGDTGAVPRGSPFFSRGSDLCLLSYDAVFDVFNNIWRQCSGPAPNLSCSAQCTLYLQANSRLGSRPWHFLLG